MGFGVPLGTWFRGELRDYMRDLLLAPDARYRGILSPAYVESLVSRHLSGEANFGQQLWSLLCFEQWLRLLPEWTRRLPEPPALTPAFAVAPCIRARLALTTIGAPFLLAFGAVARPGAAGAAARRRLGFVAQAARGPLAPPSGRAVRRRRRSPSSCSSARRISASCQHPVLVVRRG